MKTRTEKEHYIPNKSYLNYFVDTNEKPKSLWVYFDKKQVFENPSEASVKQITPINLCKESYLYETPRLPVNAIEKMLQQIENRYKYVLDTKIIPMKKLTTEDRIAVSQFISTLEMRTPLNKTHSDSIISDVRERVAHLEEQFMNKEKSKLHKELDEADKQNFMFTQTLLSAASINRYQVTDMLFVRPCYDDDEMFFITSDFPVCLVDYNLMNSFYPPTPLGATVEVTIPLTPKITLLINHLGLNGYKEIDSNFVFEINNRILQRSNKFIISPKKFGENFKRLNIRRQPQSFVVMLLSKDLIKKRSQRTDSYIKNNIKKYIKNIAKVNKDKILNTIDIVSKTKGEYEWLVRALKLVSQSEKTRKSSILFKLKKVIRVENRQIKFVTISNHTEA